VFYDYDEIEYLTDCHFRDDPAGAQRGRRNGVRAVVPGRQARRLSRAVQPLPAGQPDHPQIFHEAPCRPVDPRLVAGTQAAHQGRHVEDVFPYPQHIRFCNQNATPPAAIRPPFMETLDNE
jgi:isocitrate dehydrogenase kinase/phosphatase